MKSLVERKTFKPESKWKKLTNGNELFDYENVKNSATSKSAR